MKVKLTIKIGDQIQTINEEESTQMMGNNRGFEQLIMAKGQLTMFTNMIDEMQPDQAGKRIEMVMEFDDGQYIVIGRKPKEPEDGR